MIGIYCRGVHGRKGARCAECQELSRYAMTRLEECPYKEDKPPCSECPIHCYQPERREQVQRAMRYSGPRLMLHHPVLAIRHMLEKRKGPPK